VFFMLCKASPFRAATTEEVDKLASEADFEFPKDLHLSNEVKEFISNLLQLEPEKRMSANEAKKHPWFTNPCHNLTPTGAFANGEMNDEQKFQLRASINKMIDNKRERENPLTSKKQKKIMALTPARESVIWRRRLQSQG